MSRKLINFHSQGRIYSAPHLLKGGGMGSVLLSQGGPGAGSSYDSPESYEEITGVRLPKAGAGLGLNKKLSAILVKPLSRKPAGNIAFNI